MIGQAHGDLLPTPNISHEQFSKRILVADGDPTALSYMRRFLVAQHFRVDTATTSDEALDILRKDNNYDLVLADIGLVPMSGINFANAAGAAFPHIRFALLTRERLDDHFPAILRGQMSNVFVKTRPFLFDEFLTTVENLLQPSRSIGLQRHLAASAEIRQATVRTREDRTAAVDEAAHFFRRYRQYDEQVGEIRLSLEELINNSIYHAFRRKAGDRVRATAFTSLENDEQITLEYGRDKRYLGCSVSDNLGALDAGTVLSKLERQISLEGLMDENGRGLHLSRNLSDRMVINLKPGRLTQIVLLFAHRPQHGPKPLTVNVIPDVL